jgi:hypothetical protein
VIGGEMDYTIFTKKDMILFLGADPKKGCVPELTVVKIKKPQILIDSEKGTITIIESA